MTTHRLMEELISVATGLKDGLETLIDAFRKLIPLIEHEHELIKKSALQELELLTLEKEALGELVSVGGDKILKCADEMRRLYEGAFGPRNQASNPVLFDVLVWMKAIREAQAQDQLSSDVAKHLEARLEFLFNELKAMKSASQMKIEMNTYLTKELLRQHRENIRLIQDVQAEANATYDASGAARKQETKGVLQVKA
jgi:hypothetical protein